MNNGISAAYNRGRTSMLLTVQTYVIVALDLLLADTWHKTALCSCALALTMVALTQNVLKQREAEEEE
jgi:hypothetical protein